MTKPVATGGNEPKFKTVGEMFDVKREAIKARPRPTRRHWSYTYAADGRIVLDAKSFAWVTSKECREERDLVEEALQMWYKQQGVCAEPYLPGETYAQYVARNGRS